jgi:hypothetical protein
MLFQDSVALKQSTRISNTTGESWFTGQTKLTQKIKKRRIVAGKKQRQGEVNINGSY